MRYLLLLALAVGCAGSLGAEPKPQPIIDVHLHAASVRDFGPPGQKFCMDMLSHVPPIDPAQGPISKQLMAWQLDPDCDEPMVAAASDDALMNETLAVLKQRNIKGIVSGAPETVAAWKQAAPDHIIAGRQFNLRRDGKVSPEDIESAFKAGEFEVFAEVTNQYFGFGPDAEEFDAYWKVAAENDIPVGVHIGSMPPGAVYWGSGAKTALGNPLLLEEVLVKYPTLRVYIMHAGMPFFEQTVALMSQNPQVYADTGVLQAVMTKRAYDDFLKQMIDAGLGKRLMYGTDQMIWPEMIERSLERIEKSKVLTKEQKRDILYNNAVRFFRLDEVR